MKYPSLLCLAMSVYILSSVSKRSGRAMAMCGNVSSRVVDGTFMKVKFDQKPYQVDRPMDPETGYGLPLTIQKARLLIQPTDSEIQLINFQLLQATGMDKPVSNKP